MAGGAIAEEASQDNTGLNCVGVMVLDLRFTNPEGENWDFTIKKHRDMAKALIDSEDPDWIIGAPPCTLFSTLQGGILKRWYQQTCAEDPPKQKLTCDLCAKSITLKWREETVFCTSIPFQLPRGENRVSSRSSVRAAWVW